jgi:hypothetical protein
MSEVEMTNFSFLTNNIFRIITSLEIILTTNVIIGNDHNKYELLHIVRYDRLEKSTNLIRSTERFMFSKDEDKR